MTKKKIEVSVHPNQIVLVWDDERSEIIGAITFKETNRVVDITDNVIKIVEDNFASTDGKVTKSIFLNGGMLEDNKSVSIEMDDNGEESIRDIQLTILGSTAV